MACLLLIPHGALAEAQTPSPPEIPATVLSVENPASVEFVYAGRLGDDSGGGMLCKQDDFQISRDTAGRYFVNTNCDCGQIQVFDDEFSYVRTIGSCGQGPGELEHVVMVTANERVYAVDASARLVRFSEDLEPETTIGTLRGTPSSAAFTTDGHLAMNYYNYSTNPMMRVHTIDLQTGGNLGDCAPTTLLPNRRMEEMPMMSLASDGSGGVWAIPFGNRYRIYRCAPGAAGELRRPAEWFPDYPEGPMGHRPAVNPRGMAMANGLLWVVVYLPTEWIDEERPDPEDIPDMYQVIDVIDPAAAAVVGHARVELPGRLKIIGWVDGLAYAFSDTQDGGWVLELFEPRLVSRESR